MYPHANVATSELICKTVRQIQACSIRRGTCNMARSDVTTPRRRASIHSNSRPRACIRQIHSSERVPSRVPVYVKLVFPHSLERISIRRTKLVSRHEHPQLSHPCLFDAFGVGSNAGQRAWPVIRVSILNRRFARVEAVDDVGCALIQLRY